MKAFITALSLAVVSMSVVAAPSKAVKQPRGYGLYISNSHTSRMLMAFSFYKITAKGNLDACEGLGVLAEATADGVSTWCEPVQPDSPEIKVKYFEEGVLLSTDDKKMLDNPVALIVIGAGQDENMQLCLEIAVVFNKLKNGTVMSCKPNK